jgi:FixJ family two-component response regulator
MTSNHSEQSQGRPSTPAPGRAPVWVSVKHASQTPERDAPPRARVEASDTAASAASPGPAASPATAGLVYIVDDDASVRRSLARLLRASGYDAEAFESGDAFLEAAAATAAAPAAAPRPACVLLDVRMPAMSGTQLQQELARLDRVAPIVFLTGHGDVPMATRAMKNGAVDFLLKPFKDAELLDAIARAIARARQELAARADRQRILAHLERLTPRERQVLQGVVSGRLNKQIAYDLGVTEATIKLHRGRVMEKMAVDSLAELVHLVDRVGGVVA